MEIKDDGPQKEMCHEDPYRCSRLGRADCHPDVHPACERSPGVPGELLIRLERLLIEGKHRSASRSSGLSCEVAGPAPAASLWLLIRHARHAVKLAQTA
jgi:hypothetical protein